MTSWPIEGDVHDQLEWKMADSIANLLRESCGEMQLPRTKEWLAAILAEQADKLPQAIEQGRHSPFIAEYVLSLDACSNALVIAGYCLRFMREEGLIDRVMATGVEERLQEAELFFNSRTEYLRSTKHEWAAQESS